MNKFLAAFFALFVVLGLAGCTPSKSSNDSNTQRTIPPDLEISYDLPDGWEWLDKPNLVALTGHPSKDGANAFVKLEPAQLQFGTDTDAKNYINKLFNEWKEECQNQGTDCLAVPEYKEMKIANIMVYMAMDKSDGEAAKPYWATTLAFVKNGYMMSVAFYDRADLYVPEFTKVISTLTFSK